MLDRFSNLFGSGDFPHTMDLPAQMEHSGLPANIRAAAAFATLPAHLRSAAASRPAFRRHDYLPGQTGFRRAAGKRLHARPRRRPMGQGRLRRPRHHQGRFSGAGHDVGVAGRRGIGAASAAAPWIWPDPARTIPPTFEMMQAADTIGAFPNRKPRANGHAAPHEAKNVFTISSSKWRSSGPAPSRAI